MKQFFKTTNQLSILSTSISVKKIYLFQKTLDQIDQISNLRADRVKAFIEKYKNHPSMICIKDKISSIINPKFSFNFVSFDRP